MTVLIGLDAAADGDFQPIRRLAERDHTQSTSWHVMPGVSGHYAARALGTARARINRPSQRQHLLRVTREVLLPPPWPPRRVRRIRNLRYGPYGRQNLLDLYLSHDQHPRTTTGPDSFPRRPPRGWREKPPSAAATAPPRRARLAVHQRELPPRAGRALPERPYRRQTGHRLGATADRGRKPCTRSTCPPPGQ